MAQFCGQCGRPLPIGSESDRRHFHGGPPLATGAQIRCPFCKEVISVDSKICKFCGGFLEQRLAGPSVPIRGSAVGAVALPLRRSERTGGISRIFDWMRSHPILTILLLLLFLGMTTQSLLNSRRESAQQPETFQQSKPAADVSAEWTPGIGETAKVSSFGGGPDVLAFISESALNEYKRASLSGQDSGQAAFRSLIAAGEVIVARRGTSVSVMSSSGWNGWHKVRLVDGEHAGEVVYLLDQWTVYEK